MRTDGVDLLGTPGLGGEGRWEGSACRQGPWEGRGGVPSWLGDRWEEEEAGIGTPPVGFPRSHWPVLLPGADGKVEEDGSRVRRRGVGPPGAPVEGGRVSGALGSP